MTWIWLKSKTRVQLRATPAMKMRHELCQVNIASGNILKSRNVSYSRQRMRETWRYLKVDGRVGMLAAFCIAIFIAAGCKKKAPPPPPPPEVFFITVHPTNTPVFEEWIGTLQGFWNAQIRAQVSGYLQTQNYGEGSVVKKGDLLFQIDPRPFQAVLDQTLAKLAQDQALFARTQLDVKRYTPLAKENAISQQTLDDALQANLSAQALVKSDEASVESAKLNLEFTRITSPVDGLAGIALAQIGDLVGPSGNALTTVSTVNPIKDYFQATEQSYLQLWRYLAEPNGTNMDVPLELILADGSVYPSKGKFFSADRQINPTTGTLQVVGTFPNPENLLRPGQYGRVRAQTTVRSNVFFIPQRAVTQLQGTYQVAVVGESNKVRLANVKVGEQKGSNWIINQGLHDGDHVIVEGLQKAKEGSVVTPRPLESRSTNAPLAKAES
jgi:membrane fusion protein (multidrug efflux system)